MAPEFLDFINFVVALVAVVTVHECSHAWTANKLGDPTAKIAGRISLNPLHHLDPIGTIMLFLIHIGWGKPVPVNPHYFKNPKRDEAITALAGPLSNLVLAMVLALPLKYFGQTMPLELFQLLLTTLDVAIVLFIFNILPFPPLDGSKILFSLLPYSMHDLRNFLEQNGFYILIFFVFFLWQFLLPLISLEFNLITGSVA